ncbi:uncharacterized protein K452DRAFT_295467 [Aplosporella prunicola CBS 121167]|uniref:Protein sip5 n=1 Tax=Aplosporella prunicola CBS 121167 TaxID=1176127 RepID=A0A6A6BNT1_9PEZI|nr:uncharacterized protein K452DRAFT_295467 [Aplosporella prunicola CBS 121167]KAF2144894.1 hypothetical protein K452DRAFT_295467 [Aplosporella prunicola CBS 121167]
MGNNATKESRPGSSRGHSHPNSIRDAPAHSGHPGASRSADDRVYASRGGRNTSRPDLSFLGLGTPDRDPPSVETRRETRAEREARKLAKERELRAQERERSMRDEGVDGGYLVTLGTYTGPEDFNKQVVRQLMIERRLAPFWKGLNDHSDSWTEHQLVAAVKGLPIPPADEVPDDMSKSSSDDQNPKSADSLNGLMVPITARSASSHSDASGRLSPGQSGFSLPSPSSPISQGNTSSSPFFRGRAKTLAALTTSSRNNSQGEMLPQEVMLPKDPYVNGQRLEAFLYKDASECPICFLYYPPYLNKTRCCDQPICSECFVQIKRPDPHPPEHHDPNDPNAQNQNEPQDDCMLVSEPAACPFCVQPEFGVTYESPPFRRGLSYQGHVPPNMTSATSSSSSLDVNQPVTGNRRRATSLAADAPQVITTDKVRPDWAKKLADARAHALRRSAAATALHNAAYVIGNNQSDSRGFSLGRRRRTLFAGDSPGSSGQGTPRQPNNDALNQLLAAAEAGSGSSRPRDEGSDPTRPRRNSRRTRMEDLEELMMMEAIRLSLAAEEERKKKETKEAAKVAKKEEKKKAKEEKKAAKSGKLYGFHPVEIPGEEGQPGPSSQDGTKGKAVDRSGAGFNPMSEPTSTVNAGEASAATPADPQRHLEESRQRLHSQPSQHSDSTVGGASSTLDPNTVGAHRMSLRQHSTGSSSASSAAESESEQDSLRNTTSADGGLEGASSSFEPSPNVSGVSLGGGSTAGAGAGGAEFSEDTTPGGGAGTEPMFNFRSLTAVIGQEEEADKGGRAQHIEVVPEAAAAVAAAVAQSQPQAQTQAQAPAAAQPPPQADAAEHAYMATAATASPFTDAAEVLDTPQDQAQDQAQALNLPPSQQGDSASRARGESSAAGSSGPPPAISVTPSSPAVTQGAFAPLLPMPDLGGEVDVAVGGGEGGVESERGKGVEGEGEGEGGEGVH